MNDLAPLAFDEETLTAIAQATRECDDKLEARLRVSIDEVRTRLEAVEQMVGRHVPTASELMAAKRALLDVENFVIDDGAASLAGLITHRRAVREHAVSPLSVDDIEKAQGAYATATDRLRGALVAFFSSTDADRDDLMRRTMRLLKAWHARHGTGGPAAVGAALIASGMRVPLEHAEC